MITAVTDAVEAESVKDRRKMGTVNNDHIARESIRQPMTAKITI
jgi:hypothetical protein